jgi:RNA polymerase sigma-70 factor (family 1)
MMTITDNEAVFEALRSGDATAYATLFSAYYQRLCRYAMRFVRDDAATEDLVQDCFLRLYERREALTPMSLSSLLFTMVRNRCLNYLKHKVLVEGYQAEALKQQSGSEQLYALDMTGNADASVIYDDLKRQLDAIIAGLPPRTREVFAMSRNEGMKNKEIAAALGISEKVVEKHITKALAVMRAGLKGKTDLDYMLAVTILLLLLHA